MFVRHSYGTKSLSRLVVLDMTSRATYVYPNGDMNEAEAPSIKQYDIRIGSVCVWSAASIAIGNINAAAALFVTMFEIKKVAR
jgi:hypothetical protein